MAACPRSVETSSSDDDDDDDDDDASKMTNFQCLLIYQRHLQLRLYEREAKTGDLEGISIEGVEMTRRMRKMILPLRLSMLDHCHRFCDDFEERHSPNPSASICGLE